MSNVNKVKILSERTSGVPPPIFSSPRTMCIVFLCVWKACIYSKCVYIQSTHTHTHNNTLRMFFVLFLHPELCILYFCVCGKFVYIQSVYISTNLPHTKSLCTCFVLFLHPALYLRTSGLWPFLSLQCTVLHLSGPFRYINSALKHLIASFLFCFL